MVTGLETQLVTGVLNIFGGNVFIMGLVLIGILLGIVFMLRLPFILTIPLIVMVMFMMFDLPIVSGALKIIIGLILGVIISVFLWRMMSGGG